MEALQNRIINVYNDGQQVKAKNLIQFVLSEQSYSFDEKKFKQFFSIPLIKKIYNDDPNYFIYTGDIALKVISEGLKPSVNFVESAGAEALAYVATKLIKYDKETMKILTNYSGEEFDFKPETERFFSDSGKGLSDKFLKDSVKKYITKILSEPTVSETVERPTSPTSMPEPIVSVDEYGVEEYPGATEMSEDMEMALKVSKAKFDKDINQILDDGLQAIQTEMTMTSEDVPDELTIETRRTIAPVITAGTPTVSDFIPTLMPVAPITVMETPVPIAPEPIEMRTEEIPLTIPTVEATVESPSETPAFDYLTATPPATTMATATATTTTTPGPMGTGPDTTTDPTIDTNPTADVQSGVLTDSVPEFNAIYYNFQFKAVFGTDKNVPINMNVYKAIRDTPMSNEELTKKIEGTIDCSGCKYFVNDKTLYPDLKQQFHELAQLHSKIYLKEGFAMIPLKALLGLGEAMGVSMTGAGGSTMASRNRKVPANQLESKAESVDRNDPNILILNRDIPKYDDSEGGRGLKPTGNFNFIIPDFREHAKEQVIIEENIVYGNPPMIDNVRGKFEPVAYKPFLSINFSED